MKRFSFSDMNRAPGQILEAALVEPVALTKHGKEKLVIVSASTFQRLTGRQDAQAYTLEDAPREVHDDLMGGLEAILQGRGDDA